MDSTQAAALREIDLTVLGSRLRAARTALGLTQGELAGDAVSIAYISRIEAGQRRPDSRLLTLFAERLKTSLDFLLTGVSPRETDQFRLLLSFAELALESGDPEEAERTVRELLASPQSRAMTSLVDRGRYVLGRAMESQQRLDEAIVELETLIEVGSSSDVWIPAVIALSRCYRESGDLVRATETAEPALEQLHEAGLDGSAEALELAVTIASASFARGDSGHAVRLCLHAIDRAEAASGPSARAAAYWTASVFESRRGSVAVALPMAQRALALMAEGTNVRNLARLRAQVAGMMMRSDPPELDQAEIHLARARAELLASSGSPVDIARCDVGLARLHLLMGRPEEARTLAASVRSAVAETAPLLAADALTVQGEAEGALGEWDNAKAAFSEAASVLTAIGADRNAGQQWFELATLLDAAGDSEGAREAYRSAAAAAGLRATIPTHSRQESSSSS